MARTSTFSDQTSDVTYCSDVTLFLHATSGRLSLTAALFLRQFLAFYCFKCYLAAFSRCKTTFSPNTIPPKHTEQDQIDMKWLAKMLVFWCVSRRVGRRLIIVNKVIKKNLLPLVKILLLVLMRWNKIWSYTEKIKYPLYIDKLEGWKLLDFRLLITSRSFRLTKKIDIIPFINLFTIFNYMSF